jgi:hypothetical protein
LPRGVTKQDVLPASRPLDMGAAALASEASGQRGNFM